MRIWIQAWGCGLLVLAGLAAAPVHAADEPFPARPVTLVVPYPAGGTPDTYVRRIALKLQARLGVPFVVDNKPGAAATIGTNHVAKARPDGYTVLYATSGSMAAAPGLVKSLPYNPATDFAGVTLATGAYFTLLVPKDDPARDAAAWLASARQPGARVNWSGTGATNEALASLLGRGAGIQPAYVRYQSSVAAANDLFGGRLNAMIETLYFSRVQEAGGKARILAVSAPERLKTMPGVPTLAELVPGVSMEVWTGFFVPAKTPRKAIETLHAALREALRDPEIVRMAEDNGRDLDTTPDQTDAFLREEVPRWTRLLRSAGIEPQ